MSAVVLQTATVTKSQSATYLNLFPPFFPLSFQSRGSILVLPSAGCFLLVPQPFLAISPKMTNVTWPNLSSGILLEIGCLGLGKNGIKVQYFAYAEK